MWLLSFGLLDMGLRREAKGERREVHLTALHSRPSVGFGYGGSQPRTNGL